MFWAIALTTIGALQLPAASDVKPVVFPHFPSKVHAFVWRNWPLAPVADLAKVIGATPEEVARMGAAMGLGEPPAIAPEQQRRSYITVIRRNWHLLPYNQLLTLLGWTEEQLAFTLREDDFLYVKLGNLKPACEPLAYVPPDEATQARERAMADFVAKTFPEGASRMQEPLFQFVADLSKAEAQPVTPRPSGFSPRFCSSYFALYGDPLMEEDIDPYPDGYLDRLAASGVDAVWMHAVLAKLAPFPWDASLSRGYETRVSRLCRLTERAAQRGIGIYLYMNEPRAMPLAFYEAHPELKGAVAGDHAALCTGAPEAAEYLTESIAHVCRAVPELRGFFTITASENLTNCWSHGGGAGCPRCKDRSPAETVAGVNALIWAGIRRAESKAELIAWDWGWADAWAIDAIHALPQGVGLMSVSEWSIPIRRGGIDGVVGEYSISTVGPGPRATKHWAAARARGLKTLAKIQAGNTWELAAVPYIPAVANVAQHAANLRDAEVDGLMLGWSLGGYPSPNLEVFAEFAKGGTDSVEAALLRVAQRRYSEAEAPAVVKAWQRCSTALSEFPYDGGVVYCAPIQVGPANLLWAEATGYRASMVGIPYDDLSSWRSHYPEEVFIAQFAKMADGFGEALAELQASAATGERPSDALRGECDVMEAVVLHYRSVANQARFVVVRERLAHSADAQEAQGLRDELERLLRDELDLARRLHAIQTRDSRIGYEASNHYFYVPIDLVEKAINCQYLIDTWFSGQRDRFGAAAVTSPSAAPASASR